MYVLADFELARRHYVYTINATTAIIMANDAKGIKLKLLGILRRSVN